MTNKEKYFKDVGDLLYKIHCRTGDFCIIPMITGQEDETAPCLCGEWKGLPCHVCIDKWLNKEVTE